MGKLGDTVLSEVELDVLGAEESLVLPGEGIVGLGEDARQIVLAQRLSSTRMGKRPWNSGMRSLGRATLKAPAAMKRMCSVRTEPYRVCTTDPSSSGRRSRWTPSPLTSGPRSGAGPQILSTSSMKTMPASSTSAMASS